ncbi:MAG: DUF86 domain-containing protein [Chloroflexi bacterium]|nr:DUF86 domain-containing protein [Chloroflexota bacterium]
MNDDDRIRLEHMLAAAREAQTFAAGKTRASLNTDRGLVLILIQEITIIGEAASKVSAECRAANPQIPWVLITGMRNRLIHAYYDVNLDIIWNTVANRIPELIADLETILLLGAS